MPRVLHVISDLAAGGAQTQLRLLAAGGRAAMVATLRRPGPDGVAVEAPVEWLGARFPIDPFAARRLTLLVRRAAPDALQSWDAPAARLCRWERRLTGTPWAHTLRGLEPPTVGAGADVLLATDSLLADALQAPGRPVAVVPNAFDPALAAVGLPDRAGARARLRAAGIDVPDGAPVLVASLRIDSPVAAKELAWGADLVRVLRPGLRLLVAGEGTGRVAAERFAVRACAGGTVLWLGARHDLATLYAAADVVWCGTGDGVTPTPALEGLASGRPVVVAAATGRAEAFVAGSGAPPAVLRWDDRAAWARTTARLLGDPEAAAAQGQAGAAWVAERHSASAAAAAHRAAIESLLQAGQESTGNASRPAG